MPTSNLVCYCVGSRY